MFRQTPQKAELFAHALRTGVLGLFAVVVGVVGVSVWHPATTEAATSGTVNFQARLENATGSIAADGYYNVEFKLYSVSSGGTAEWTEDYTYSSGSGQCSGPVGTNDCRARVANGYLTVNLGSVTAFSGINWNQQQWLTMNIGGTNSSGTITYDGEMNPRLLLTAVPYAFTSGSISATSSGHTGTVSFGSVSNDPVLTLPNETGTLCVEGSANCNFAAASGSGNYVQLQGSTPGVVQTGNFNISGTGILGTLQSAAATALTITGNAASTWSTSTGDLTLQAGSGTVSLGSSTALTASGALTITGGSTLALKSTTSSSVTLDSGTTGTVNIGTGANAKTIQLGATNSAITDTINVGNNANASGISTITVGSIQSTSSTAIQGGSGGINLGTGGVANTIQIGNTSGAVTQTINIGTNSTASSTNNVVIGSTVAGSVQLQPAGGVILGGTGSQTGQLLFANAINSNTVTLKAGTTGSSYSLVLPTSIGSSSQCLQGSVSGSVNSLGWGSCGGGAFVTLQGSTPGTADTGNFNISGVGIAATFQASTFDRATSGTLAIGSTNATAITVGNTTSNVATTINGTALIKPTTGHDSTTAFQVQNASGNNLLTVDSSGTAIVLGNDGTPSALTVRGGAASGTNIAGANLTVDASNGTGSGGSGDIIIRTAGAAAPNTITFDAANGTYSTGTSRTIDNTFSYTIGSGTDRAMCAFLNNGSGATLVSMTYAGTSLSSVGSAGNSVLWCGLIPGTVTAGSHSFSITWSTGDGGMGMGVATYNNVSSIGTPNSATGTSATPTVSVSSNATQMIVDAMANSGANATGAGSGQTIRWQNTTWGGLDGSDKPGQATSTTMSWTLSTSRSWSIIAVPLNPDSGSSTTGDTLTDRLHVTASGNVGINNANPQYTLDVAGTALVKATSTAAFQVQDASSNNILTVDTSDGYIGIGIGNTTPSRTLDVLGTWGGNEDDNQQTNNASGTTTVTDATHALVYHLTANKTSGNNSSTTIFNVTGLPDVNGTFAYFLMQASHNSGLGTSAQQCINAEINGSAQLIGSTVCDTASNSAQHTNFHQFMVMRINNSWTVITSISNSSYPVTAS